jgi:tetratricopeptide (TPR) repeat protein
MKDESAAQRLDRCLKRAEENPGSAAAQFNLGLAYTRLGKVNQAENAYRKALEIDPDLVEAWVNLGGALLLKWDFKGALEANREALARRDDLLLAHYNLGQASLYLGDADGLLQACRRVVELDPGHAAGHYYLAVGLLAKNEVEQARETLAKAMALGHRPTAEFLRELERAEQQTTLDNSNLVTNIGAEAPEDSKEN